MNRYFALLAVSGAVLLISGTYLHPSQWDPNEAAAAFAEYAADRHWLTSHLMQLSGAVLIMAALVLLARAMAGGRADTASSLGAYGAAASVALAAALQAVDAVALKAMVNAWAAAPDSKKEMLFQAALAVRQIEIGLASMFALLSGVTISLYGIAQLLDSRFPNWLGYLAIAGGTATAVGGYVMASSGFSEPAMLITMSSTILLLCWICALAVFWSRKPGLA